MSVDRRKGKGKREKGKGKREKCAAVAVEWRHPSQLHRTLSISGSHYASSVRAVCRDWRRSVPAVGLAGCWTASGQAREGARGRVDITAGSVAQRRAWTSRVDGMMRSGELRIRQTREDTLLPGRTHERANQYYRGVRVFGGDVARQLQDGVDRVRCSARSTRGSASIASPVLDEDRARAILEARTGRRLPIGRPAGADRAAARRRRVRADLAAARRDAAATRASTSSTRARERRSSTTAIGKPRAPSGARARRARRHQEDQRACQRGPVSGDRRPAARRRSRPTTCRAIPRAPTTS